MMTRDELRQAAKDLGLTRHYLAKRAGLWPNTLARMEDETDPTSWNPTANTMEALERVLREERAKQG